MTDVADRVGAYRKILGPTAKLRNADPAGFLPGSAPRFALLPDAVTQRSELVELSTWSDLETGQCARRPTSWECARQEKVRPWRALVCLCRLAMLTGLSNQACLRSSATADLQVRPCRHQPPPCVGDRSDVGPTARTRHSDRRPSRLYPSAPGHVPVNIGKCWDTNARHFKLVAGGATPPRVGRRPGRPGHEVRNPVSGGGRLHPG